MIQGVINRLSHNSFLLKGWSVVLISAMFALAAGSSQLYFIYLAYFPLIVFWVLDAYFLWQERLFRALYDRVRALREDQIDFSMDTTAVKSDVKAWPEVLFSLTLLLFHGTVLFSIVFVLVIAMLTVKGGS